MVSFAGRASCAILLVLALLLAPLRLHAQALFEFNLPAQPLGNSLRAVANKAHVTVAFDPASVAGRRAPPLKGAHTPQAALELLLQGSGLRVRVTAGGSYWIEAAPVRHQPPA